MDPAQRTLHILAEVTEDEEVGRDLDRPLYGDGLLDSLGTVNLMVRFSQEFGLEISPAEFDPEAWATPRLVIADVTRRLER